MKHIVGGKKFKGNRKQVNKILVKNEFRNYIQPNNQSFNYYIS